jgi:hypothetical protein
MVELPLPILKSKGKTMVEKLSPVKQLPPTHVCKIGLRFQINSWISISDLLSVFINDTQYSPYLHSDKIE